MIDLPEDLAGLKPFCTEPGEGKWELAEFKALVDKQFMEMQGIDLSKLAPDQLKKTVDVFIKTKRWQAVLSAKNHAAFAYAEIAKGAPLTKEESANLTKSFSPGGVFLR